MKKTVALSVLLLLISCLLCGCFPGVMFIPDEASIGKSKEFKKDGITLLLTDRFEEQESERGFDAYYVSDFCGVVVLREEFTIEEGLADKTLEQYTKNVISNNGHTNIQPHNKDGLWFYEHSSGGNFVRSYCYKGSDAFYVVQYICSQSDKNTFDDLFYLWAESVAVE